MTPGVESRLASGFNGCFSFSLQPLTQRLLSYQPTMPHANLVRARSVVQVHPGPPSNSPINTRRFTLSPHLGNSHQNPFCQKFAKRSGRVWPPSSGRSEAVPPLIAMLHDLGTPNNSRRRAKARLWRDGSVQELLYLTYVPGIQRTGRMILFKIMVNAALLP
jgi:hypothetical protein